MTTTILVSGLLEHRVAHVWVVVGTVVVLVVTSSIVTVHMVMTLVKILTMVTITHTHSPSHCWTLLMMIGGEMLGRMVLIGRAWTKINKK